MALIKCPECGKENVSDSANACPNCGFNISRYYTKEIRTTSFKLKKDEMSKKARKVLWFLASIFVITTIASGRIWMKSNIKIKDYNVQIEEKQKMFSISKALVNNPDGDGYKYYDSYNNNSEKLEKLNDAKKEQKEMKLAAIICFSVSLVLLIVCLILL